MFFAEESLSCKKNIYLFGALNIFTQCSKHLLSLTKIVAQLLETGNVTTLAGYLHLLDECGLLCGLQKYAAFVHCPLQYL